MQAEQIDNNGTKEITRMLDEKDITIFMQINKG